MLVARDSPLNLPGNADLESWHDAGRELTLAVQMLAAGSSPPNPVNLAGNREQSLGLYVDIPVGGTRGTATYRAFIDGGPPAGSSTPYQTGTTAASVPLTGLGLDIEFPTGTYSDTNTYTAAIDSVGNLTPLTRTMVSSSTLSAKPRIKWQAKNGRPSIHLYGPGVEGIRDATSDWAANLAGGEDAPFTWFIVARADVNAIATALASIGHSSVATQTLFLGAETDNDYRVRKTDDAATSIARDSTGTSSDTDWHVFRLRHSGTVVELWRDSAQVTLASAGAQDVGDCTFDTVALLGQVTGGSFGRLWRGELGEEISYSAALSDSDCTAIETYLRSGWAI